MLNFDHFVDTTDRLLIDCPKQYLSLDKLSLTNRSTSGRVSAELLRQRMIRISWHTVWYSNSQARRCISQRHRREASITMIESRNRWQYYGHECQAPNHSPVQMIKEETLCRSYGTVEDWMWIRNLLDSSSAAKLQNELRSIGPKSLQLFWVMMVTVGFSSTSGHTIT